MKRVFETQYGAEQFAKEVNGTVRQSWLPGYMSVTDIWIVEWEDNNEQIKKGTV